MEVNLKKYISEYNAVRNTFVEKAPVLGPLEFEKNCKGIHLTSVERFTVKCIYGIPLDGEKKCIEVWDKFLENKLFDFTEKEYFKYLRDAGRINQTSEEELLENSKTFWKIILPYGRRAGKSFIVAFIDVYEVYKLLKIENPQRFFDVIEGEKIFFKSVATKTDQARIIFDFTKAIISNNEFFGDYARILEDKICFRTREDIRRGKRWGREDKDVLKQSSIILTFDSCIARGLRGPGTMIAAFDEYAHFVLETGKVTSDEEIWKAVTPSISTFNNNGRMYGKVFLISSPLTDSGIFAESYKGSFEDKTNSLMIQIPSWEANPKRLSSRYLKSEYDRDPKVFRAEFGGEFVLQKVMRFIEDYEWLDKAFSKDRKPARAGLPGVWYFLGLDVGFKEDWFGSVLVHVNENEDIVVDRYDLWDPKDFGGEIDEGQIIDYVEDLNKNFNIRDGMLDQFNGIVLEQRLKKKGVRNVKLVDMTEKLNSTMFLTLKVFLRSSKILGFVSSVMEEKKEIENYRRLLEFKKSQYLIKVVEGKGCKMDGADALARAVYLAFTSLQTTVMGREKMSGGNPHKRTPGTVSTGRRTPGLVRNRWGSIKGSIPGYVVSR